MIPRCCMVSLFWSAFVGQSGCFVLIRTDELNGVGVGITKKQYGHLHNVIFQIEC